MRERRWSPPCKTLPPPPHIPQFLTIKSKSCYWIFVFRWCAFVETNDEDFQLHIVDIVPGAPTCLLRFAISFIIITDPTCFAITGFTPDLKRFSLFRFFSYLLTFHWLIQIKSDSNLFKLKFPWIPQILNSIIEWTYLSSAVNSKC